VSDQRDPQSLARDAASSIPYSPGLRVVDTIHVSGAIGRPPDGDLPADIAEQFRQLYRNIAAVLGEAEATWADVVEMTSYHVGLREHIETLFAVQPRVRQRAVPRMDGGRRDGPPQQGRRARDRRDGRAAAVSVLSVSLAEYDIADVRPCSGRA
jgi:enamine deaminase RidA (YjgF/YER057c/UK114 family)